MTALLALIEDHRETTTAFHSVLKRYGPFHAAATALSERQDRIFRQIIDAPVTSLDDVALKAEYLMEEVLEGVEQIDAERLAGPLLASLRQDKRPVLVVDNTKPAEPQADLAVQLDDCLSRAVFVSRQGAAIRKTTRDLEARLFAIRGGLGITPSERLS